LPRAENFGLKASMSSSCINITKDEGVIQLRRTDTDNAFEVTEVPHKAGIYLPKTHCRTTLQVELIEYLAQRWDFAWFCDSLCRFEDSDSVVTVLRNQLFSYFARADFAGKRLLDFGCGYGASSFAMARMLPQTQIVGVELDPSRIETANHINASLKLPNLQFLCSPSGEKPPEGIGNFDFVMLSAVYEHLLPKERKVLMPLLWSTMKPASAIFINQTPYRYSPYEAHSTGLWLINYMPDRLAHLAVRLLAKRNRRVNKSPDWDVHLRGGLRGATEKEIVRNLSGADAKAVRILQPRQNGLRDRADYWLSCTNQRRYRTLKKWTARGFRVTDRLWGTIPRPNLEVVIEKQH
jgi:2-polyprenyl-3-methyl-5-hydroxy-6-metoxy-1,4-benzoquinol methylase